MYREVAAISVEVFCHLCQQAIVSPDDALIPGFDLLQPLLFC